MTSHAASAASSGAHVRITTRTATLSVGVALFLILIKAWAWFATHSVAMLASLADSTLDLAASLFTFFAVRYAATPPDSEHRFGHGKAEAFAGLMQSGLVALSAVLVGVEAVHHFIWPSPVSHGIEGIAVMAVSMLATLALITVQTQAVRQTGSVATRGDRLHYAADLASNFAVILGIGAAAFWGLTWADAAAGLLVAVWLIWGAMKLSGEAADNLLDHEMSQEDRAQIIALVLADPALRRVHDLRTRSSGPYMHIQMHVELDPTMTLERAHHLIVGAEQRIRTSYPSADIIIHPDPRGRAEPHGHEDFEERRQAEG